MCASCPALVKQRSVEQHRRLFALVKAAFMHWPEDHWFRPNDAEHLRKWLLVQAGHCDVTTIHIGPYAVSDALDIVFRSFKAANEHPFTDIRGSVITLRVARSTAFDKLSHKEACKVYDDLGSVIEEEMGMSADRLLREAGAAA